jgi:hypothetical protein
MEFLRQGEALLDDGEEEIGGQRRPDLYADGILGDSEKRLDPQVLLYRVLCFRRVTTNALVWWMRKRWLKSM